MYCIECGGEHGIHNPNCLHKDKEVRNLKVSLDGNALCITKNDFVNLQESPAFFVELNERQIKEWKEFIEARK